MRLSPLLPVSRPKWHGKQMEFPPADTTHDSPETSRWRAVVEPFLGALVERPDFRAALVLTRDQWAAEHGHVLEAWFEARIKRGTPALPRVAGVIDLRYRTHIGEVDKTGWPDPQAHPLWDVIADWEADVLAALDDSTAPLPEIDEALTILAAFDVDRVELRLLGEFGTITHSSSLGLADDYAERNL